MDTFFFFKKLIGSFVSPVPIVVFLLFCGLYFHFVKQRYSLSGKIFGSALILLLLFSIPIIPGSLLRPLELEYPAFNDPPIQVDHIMVLGCWNNEDEKLPEVSRIAPCSLYRVVEAFRLSRVYPDAKVILSGHKVPGFEASHPDYSADFLVSLGLDRKRIEVLAGSKDTESEADLVKPVSVGKSNLLITSADHMKRAVNIFDSAGIQVIPVPVGHLTSRGKTLSYHVFTPDAAALALSETVMYEFLGNLWFTIKQLVNE